MICGPMDRQVSVERKMKIEPYIPEGHDLSSSTSGVDHNRRHRSNRAYSDARRNHERHAYTGTAVR